MAYFASWNPIIGLPFETADTNGTQALSTANTWISWSFFAPGDSSRSVSKVVMRVTAVTGTIGAGDLRCDVYSNTSGAPGTSLGNTTTVDSYPTGAAWVEFTFGTPVAVTAGAPFWIVIQCPDAGAGNYVTVCNFYALYERLIGASTSGTNPCWGKHTRISTDGGSTWTNALRRTSGSLKVEFSDGSFIGDTIYQSGYADYKVYGTDRYTGAIFTTPANAKLNVRGGYLQITKTLNPVANATLKLFAGTSLLATSNEIDISSAYHNTIATVDFDSVVELAASTSHRLVLATGSGGDASNYWSLWKFDIKDDASSKALGPFAGTWQTTYSTDTGASFTEVSTKWPAMGMILDCATPFAAQSAGGGFPILGGSVVS